MSSITQVIFVILLSYLICVQSAGKRRRLKDSSSWTNKRMNTDPPVPPMAPILPGDVNTECALFNGKRNWSRYSGGSFYLKLGPVLDVSHDVTISMEIFPDQQDLPDGILLSMGTADDFEYFVWKTEAVVTEYFVIEFNQGALSLLLKALGTNYMKTVEIYNTEPTPYTVLDGKWHKIEVVRKSYWNSWVIKIDDLELTREITKDIDLTLKLQNVFMGGRPHYYFKQYSGLIRNVYINGAPVILKGKDADGEVQVMPCISDEIRRYRAN